MNFASDNVAPAAPEILAALVAANQGAALPYGNDEATRRLEACFEAVFETGTAVFPVATGTAANALALAALAPPYGAVFCHPEAHILASECGAPEFFTGGARLVPVAGEHGKITPAALAAAVQAAGPGAVHHVQPAVLSLADATEAGTLYTPAEIAALAEVARRHGMAVHLDGARFANAVAALGCSAAELTWRAGVDALSFGATKGGAFGAEAVVLFRRDLAESFAYRRKRGGHLLSKMRFLAVQLEAYLAEGLWLRLARHANDMARRLANGLVAIPGAGLDHPAEANEVFATLPDAAIRGAFADGFTFYRWGGEAATACRFVCAYDTRAEDVDALLASFRRHTPKAKAG